MAITMLAKKRSWIEQYIKKLIFFRNSGNLAFKKLK